MESLSDRTIMSDAYGAPQGDPNAAQQPPQPHDAQDAATGRGGKKRRAYAGQAFEIGAGGNSALNQQQVPPTASQGYGTQPQMNYGYPTQPAAEASQQPQQPAYGQPSYGQPAAAPAPGQQPAYGQPQYVAQPQGGYPAPGADVGGMTQQFSQTGFGGQTPATAQSAPAMLNRLQTSDLISQPFHVSEVDQPPPPIAMPPNVRCRFVHLYSSRLLTVS